MAAFASSMFPMPFTVRTSTDSLQLALRLDRLSLSTTAQSALHFRRPSNLSFYRGDSLKGIPSSLLFQPINLMNLLQ